MIGNPLLAAQVPDLNPSLSLFQNPDDLLLVEPAAFDAYEAALSSAPHDDHTVGNVAGPYARFLMRVGEHQRAIEILKNGLKASPSAANLHISLGDAYRATDQYDLARKSYTNVLVLDLGNASDVAESRSNLKDLDILQEFNYFTEQPPISSPIQEDGKVLHHNHSLS